jgi:hypothetical protein
MKTREEESLTRLYARKAMRKDSCEYTGQTNEEVRLAFAPGLLSASPGSSAASAVTYGQLCKGGGMRQKEKMIIKRQENARLGKSGLKGIKEADGRQLGLSNAEDREGGK